MSRWLYVECRNFFQRESSGFLFVSGALFAVLIDISWSVFADLACASMLFGVKFHVGMREVWMLWEALREKEFRKKKEIMA